ncbi:uncharacterized protein BDV17DRAFT_301546 [Aspergillus undulatus]|uniref:uncharacterized protein n=1 Tax=Aspergillus undulatus TaxID=1810928 RepID=UPI003CCCE194
MPLTLPCDACSFRRVKCDGKNPCSTCLRREQSCTYLKVRKRRGPKGPRRSTNARVQAMQRNLGIEKSCSMREASLPASDETPTSPELDDPLLPPLPVRRRISLSTYYTYIDIFRSQLYTVWPIVSINRLKAQLSDSQNTEAYALAAALCAATLAQLRLPGHTNAQEPILVTSADFVRECTRMRTGHGYQNIASLESLLTSLFLHMYYANVDQIPLATFALRDAITHAHLLNLGHESNKDAQVEEKQLRLRTYWVLLVTERTFCMQHDLPITLQTIDDLPVPVDDGDSDPALLTGFCSLVRLFTRIDGPLLQTAYLSPHPAYSRAKIADIQEALLTGATKDPNIDEVQRVDIWITLAWLSSLLWQYSASQFMLTSECTSSDVFFAPSYPFIIARNFLSLVCDASLDSVRPHGYGMEIKLFQLANSLIDVIVYVPSLSRAYDGSDWGPRHAVVALERLLDIVAGGRSERLDKLHSRMAQMDYTPTPMRALSSESTESDESEEGSPIDEESKPFEGDGNVSESQWSEAGRKEDLLVDFSSTYPGPELVYLPAGGNGEVSYEVPVDILALTHPYLSSPPPQQTSLSTSTSIFANSLARTFLPNKQSTSAKVLPFVSGNLKYAQLTKPTLTPAKKNPLRAPHPQAVGFSILGTITPLTIMAILYTFRASTIVLPLSREDGISETTA